MIIKDYSVQNLQIILATFAADAMQICLFEQLYFVLCRSTLTVVKWLQSDTQLLHSITDDASTESLASLYRLRSECSELIVDTPTIPQADKVIGLFCITMQEHFVG